MASYKTKYKCPQCGVTIFNRRFPNCEACQAPLPVQLLYSEDEIAAIDEEIRKSDQRRSEMSLRIGLGILGDGGDFGD